LAGVASARGIWCWVSAGPMPLSSYNPVQQAFDNGEGKNVEHRISNVEVKNLRTGIRHSRAYARKASDTFGTRSTVSSAAFGGALD